MQSNTKQCKAMQAAFCISNGCSDFSRGQNLPPLLIFAPLCYII